MCWLETGDDHSFEDDAEKEMNYQVTAANHHLMDLSTGSYRIMVICLIGIAASQWGRR